MFCIGIVHIASFLSGNLSYSALYTKKIINVIYHANWLIPICGLCYISNLSSYQALSDHIYKYVNNLPKDHVIPKLNQKDISNTTYGLLVWLICYIQMQLLLSLIPVILSYIASCFVLSSTAISGAPGLPNITIMYLIFQIFSLLSQFIGVFMSCIMFAMYGFEPYWISNDLDPDSRLCILENHWAYFFGFGLPYYLLFRVTPFFIGYGAYLALFPFCIMLGSLSDYKAAFFANRFIISDSNNNSSSSSSANNRSGVDPSSSSSSSSTSSHLRFPRIAIFQPARQWTLFLLKWFDENIKLKRKFSFKSGHNNSAEESLGLGTHNKKTE